MVVTVNKNKYKKKNYQNSASNILYSCKIMTMLFTLVDFSKRTKSHLYGIYISYDGATKELKILFSYNNKVCIKLK